MKSMLLPITTALALSACSTVQIPAGQESQRTFTQESSRPYQEAYRTIAKQMRACYRVIGLFGNGYDVQADLDTANQSGAVEVYHVGLTGASKPEDSIFSRTVTVQANGAGSIIKKNDWHNAAVCIRDSSLNTWLA